MEAQTKESQAAKGQDRPALDRWLRRTRLLRGGGFPTVHVSLGKRSVCTILADRIVTKRAVAQLFKLAIGHIVDSSMALISTVGWRRTYREALGQSRIP